MRIAGLLFPQLQGRRCRVYSSDVRVRVVETGLDTYPDLSVVCGEERRDREDRNALVNPVVLVEVLSPSTEAYDGGEKLDHYRRIPGLREVLLVSFREPAIELWTREEASGEWRSRTVREGEVAELASIGCRLAVDDVFRDPLA
jgi:Uma2 family endonuclease